ncbi:MAG: hypothetical protein WAT23_14070, partial [Chromatiaceae bacterium]
MEGLDAHLLSDTFDMREIHRRLSVGSVFEVGEESDEEDEDEWEERKEGVNERRDESGIEESENDKNSREGECVPENRFVAKERGWRCVLRREEKHTLGFFIFTIQTQFLSYSKQRESNRILYVQYI